MDVGYHTHIVELTSHSSQTSYRTDHDSGDWSDMTYGIRWNGEWGSIGYSFAYMKTFQSSTSCESICFCGVTLMVTPDMLVLARGL